MDKKRVRYLFLGAVVICLVFIAIPSYAQKQSITFVNQSHEPSVVRLEGPTTHIIKIPAGTRQIRDVLPGNYQIKIRYGTKGGYRFDEGEVFKIPRVTGAQSKTIVTLHGIADGDKKSYIISRDAVDESLRVRTGDANEPMTYEYVIDIKVPDGWTRMSDPPVEFEMGYIKSIGDQQAEFLVHHESISNDKYDSTNMDVWKRWDEAVKKQYSVFKKLRSPKPEVKGQLLASAAYDLTDSNKVTRRLYTCFRSGRTAFEIQCNAPRESWKYVNLDFRKMIASLSVTNVPAGRNQSVKLIDHPEPGSEEALRKDAATKIDQVEKYIEPVLLDGEVELTRAVRDRQVQVVVSGNGLNSINVSLESKSKNEIFIVVLAGTIFEPDSSRTQNMVTLVEKKIKLSTYGERKSFSIAVACANMNRDTPDKDDSFKISTAKVPGDLSRLLKLDKFHKTSSRVQQFAIWTITDNPQRNGYMGIGFFGFGSGPTDNEMQTIKELFINAGIPLVKYRAFVPITKK